jgi:hypothetical protein
MFSFQQNQGTREWNRFCPEAGGRGWRKVAQTIYTYISKCKNNKIKERKKNPINWRVLALF